MLTLARLFPPVAGLDVVAHRELARVFMPMPSPSSNREPTASWFAMFDSALHRSRPRLPDDHNSPRLHKDEQRSRLRQKCQYLTNFWFRKDAGISRKDFDTHSHPRDWSQSSHHPSQRRHKVRHSNHYHNPKGTWRRPRPCRRRRPPRRPRSGSRRQRAGFACVQRPQPPRVSTVDRLAPARSRSIRTRRAAQTSRRRAVPYTLTWWPQSVAVPP
jgi:hypothetical protein